MSDSANEPNRTSWRSRPAAALPLALFQAIAFAFVELPTVYYIRSIECERYLQVIPPHIPELPLDALCRHPDVQKAYTRDVAWFYGIMTILSVLVAGPYGKLSDTQGRRKAMGLAALCLFLGDGWLYLSTIIPAIRTPHLLMLTAVLSGLGGGITVLSAAQSALIADTSSPASRSFYMGLSFVMEYIASAVIPAVAGFFISKEMFGICFAAAVLARTIHFLYLVFIPREPKHDVHPSLGDSENTTDELSSGKSRTRVVIESFTLPLGLIFGNMTLLLLALASFSKELAIGAFPVFVVYADKMFGLGGIEIGTIVSAMSVTRTLAVVALMPCFIWLYRRLTAVDNTSAAQATTADPTESTPLLREASGSIPPPAHDDTSNTVTLKQDLLITRLFFFVDTFAFIGIGLSRTSLGLAASVVAGCLGAPANPALRALITLAAGPTQIGTVLAGFSIADSVAGVIKNPVMFGVYRLTMDKAPWVIWYFCSALFTLCGLMVCVVRPRWFNNKPSMNA